MGLINFVILLKFVKIREFKIIKSIKFAFSIYGER